MLTIIPAILTDDPKELEEKIQEVELAFPPIGTNLPRIQIDIIDGIFAYNKTVSLEDLAKIDNCSNLDIHLMVKEPIDWVDDCVKAKADRVIGQVEMMSNQRAFVDKVKGNNMSVGLAVDLETPVTSIDQSLLGDLDVILIMSVKAGFGGQRFQEEIASKVAWAEDEQYANSYKYKICLDGGINESNIAKISYMGADEVAIGHSLWVGDLKENLEALKNVLS